MAGRRNLYMEPGWVNSEPLRIRVGDGGDVFTIHESILNSMSQIMVEEVARINKESPEAIHLFDVEPKTFGCLLEFAYTGDFRSPGFYRTDPGHIPRSLRTKPNYTDLMALDQAWDRFVENRMDYDEDQLLYEVEENSHDEDALLVVAKVHELAMDYEIDTLQELCLNKLQRLMIQNQQTLDIVPFLKYLPDKELCSSDLYELAIEFATLMAQFLKDDDDFTKLLGDKPNLASEIFWCYAEFVRLENR